MDMSAKDVYQRKYKAEHKEAIKKYGAERYLKTKEHHKKLCTLWREENREYKNQISKEWQSANKPRRAASEAKRRSRKLNATPPWLTEEDHRNILKIYEYAATLGYHVDHIVPLQGKKVCGLHVPWNLQPLSPKENMIKHNCFNEAEVI